MAVTSEPSVPRAERGRWTSRLTALAVLVVIVTYGIVGPSPAVAAVLALAAVIPLLGPWRVQITPGAQLLAAVLFAAIGVAVITTAFVPPEPVQLGTLRVGWSAGAMAMLAVAISRLYWARPGGGDAVTLAVALFALASCGGTVSGPVYPSAIVAFLVAAAASARVADPGRAPWRGLSARWLLTCLVAVAVALGTVGAAVVLLPYGHSWMVRQIMQSAGDRAGFSTQLALGSLQGLLLSERVVLRVRGSSTDYLRGAVFTRYFAGRWSAPADPGVRTVETPRSLPPGGGLTQIELVQDDSERYFVPLDAAEVAFPTGLAAVDRNGILLPVAAQPTERFWIRTGAERVYTVARPDAADLAVPPNIKRQIEALAAEWTVGLDEPEAMLEAIERRLREDFEYSLAFTRLWRSDPVVDFLLRERKGHCEYFASAMVLLSRSRGIPARVVGGYRVMEENPLGGHFVVRERHAHTWVEAWLPSQGWRRYDPTPPSELAASMSSTTPWVGALYDLAGAKWAALLWWLDQRTPLEIASALVVLVLLAAFTRWIQALRRRPRPVAGSKPERPLPCFERLSEALAVHGLPRAPHEPIELLARRVGGSTLPEVLAARATELLERYAALRYGGRGDEASLVADVDHLVGDLSKLANAVAARAPDPA